MIVAILLIPVVMSLMMLYVHHIAYKKGLEVGQLSVRPMPVIEAKIECLCNHGPNFHKDGSGACGQTVEWSLQGFTDAVSYTHRTKCRCTKYVGPEYTPLTMDLLQIRS